LRHLEQKLLEKIQQQRKKEKKDKKRKKYKKDKKTKKRKKNLRSSSSSGSSDESSSPNSSDSSSSSSSLSTIPDGKSPADLRRQRRRALSRQAQAAASAATLPCKTEKPLLLPLAFNQPLAKIIRATITPKLIFPTEVLDGVYQRDDVPHLQLHIHL
jgi:hypothetical protein